MPDLPHDPTHALREHARKALGFMMGSLLTNGEPSLVAQARQARGSAEQSQCYDAVRELRLKGRQLQELFVSGVLTGFDEVPQPRPAPSAPTPSRPMAPTMDLDALGVVKDAHLEQQIAVDNIASRACHEHREALLVIGRQLARRSGSRRVEIESLPIGPQKLASTFMGSCERVGVEPAALLLFSRLFTRFVIDELGPFYQDCIQLLPPEQDQDPLQPAGSAAVAGAGAAHPVAVPTMPAASGTSDGAEPESGWDPSRTPLVLPPGKAMAMPRNALDEALRQAQENLLDPAQSFFSANPRGGVQPLRIQELVNEALSASGFSRPMSLPAEVVEAMGLLRLLFEHALRDNRIPAAIRRTVRLLEVPFLRLALREPETLSSAAHPARALFGEMCSAAAARPSSVDPASDDFPRLVQLLVMRVLGDYDKDRSVFDAVLADLRRYLAVHGARTGSPPGAQPPAPGPARAPPPPPPPRPAAIARPAASPEFHALVEKIPLEGWIELRPQGAPRRRLRLAGRVPRSGMLVFVDTDGEKAGEWSRNDLASMIENGEAVIIRSGAPPHSGRR